MENLWSKVTDSLRERITPQNFDIWIKPIQFLSMDGENVELQVPNRFFKDWIAEHYATHIKEVLSFITERHCILHFRIGNQKSNEKLLPSPSSSKREQKGTPATSGIFTPKYTFENFVVGSSNQFAHAACLAVADQPAKNYNPLFIYGGCWPGKDPSSSRDRKPYSPTPNSSGG